MTRYELTSEVAEATIVLFVLKYYFDTQKHLVTQTNVEQQK